MQCLDAGTVTSLSLIPNMADSENAARRARERSLPVGLHLNITDGSPLSAERDVATLLQASGYFMEPLRLRQAFASDEVQHEHIERELRAQIEWFLERVGQPTHCDAHHHMHVHPSIAPLLGVILERYGIQCVRLPREPIDDLRWEISEERREHIQRTNVESAAAAKVWEEHGLRWPDHFRGLALSGQASAKRLRHVLSSLPEGVIELMVHPGAADPEGDEFGKDPQRETECNMLLDPELPGLLMSRGIELISYADL